MNGFAEVPEAEMDVVRVPHAGWQECWLNLRPEHADACGWAGDFLRRSGAAVVRQDAFVTNGSSGDWTVEAGGRMWPVARLRGNGGGPGMGGSQILAVTGRPMKPVWVSGQLLGHALEDGHGSYCWLAGVTSPDLHRSRAEQTRDILELMEEALRSVGMSFSHVVRTWFFNHRILEWYGEFNRIRTAFFRERGIFDGVVPASTGIGMSNAAGAALVAGLLAVRAKDGSLTIRALPSPLQCPAVEYGSSFSRAVEIAAPGQRRVLVSGTASIDLAGRTAHAGDTGAQIELTMEVVEAILASRQMGWRDVTRSIVYFKGAANTPMLTAWRRRHGVRNLHQIVTEADVCRDDLLFEIEVDACVQS